MEILFCNPPWRTKHHWRDCNKEVSSSSNIFFLFNFFNKEKQDKGCSSQAQILLWRVWFTKQRIKCHQLYKHWRPLTKMCYLVIFVKPTNIVVILTFESQPTLRQDKGNELEEWGKGILWFKCIHTHVWKCKGWSPNIPTWGIGSL